MKKRLTKVGASPGTLIAHPDIVLNGLSISVMDYNENELIEKDNVTVEECVYYLDTPSVTWIEISGMHNPKYFELMGQRFHLHPLLLEDILSGSERPKLENYKENIFIVLRLLKFNEHNKELGDEQISLVLGKNYVISWTEKERYHFDPIKERLRNGKGKIRKMGADYLAYALIDAIVDNYFVVLEKVDEQLEQLEDDLVASPTPGTLRKIQMAKRSMALLRRFVWPTREVISHFLREETPLIQPATTVYMQDVYDHTIQTIETIESFRDIVSGMLDIYLSSMSQKLNEIMKVLTVVATLFTPLTFMASIYGMNFDYMPELHNRWAYPAVLSVMAISAGTMLYFFRKKQWI